MEKTTLAKALLIAKSVWADLPDLPIIEGVLVPLPVKVGAA